jgi:putative transposase
MTAARRRLIAGQVRDRFGVSQRRVSRALGLARSTIRYTPVISDERAALARRIEALSGIHPRFGYRRIWVMLDREGWSVNKKTVRRHWLQLGLRLAGKPAKIRPRRPHGRDANACHLRHSRGKDDVWTWDLLFDRTRDGRSLKWMNFIGEYICECMALEARRGMTAEEIRVILAEVADRRGGPPHRNGYAESFHSKLRDEFLNLEDFESEAQAQALGTLWKGEYNTERPHSSLAYQTPSEYAARFERYVPIDESPSQPPSDEHPHP